MSIFSLMFFTFSVRFFLYSVIRNPILVLPVELTNGVTFALTYSALVSYADHIAPDSAEGTLQGIVGAAFLGIGKNIMSIVYNFNWVIYIDDWFELIYNNTIVSF